MASIRITQLSPAGVSGQRYSSFAGKGGVAFPTQYSGLRVFYDGGVQELCLVAAGDASGGLFLDKNGTTMNIYLVDTTDPDASSVRVQTGSGVKSIRLKT